MELKACPFCGDESGSTNILCGENNDGKWWCKAGHYNTRTPSPSADKLIEAAKNAERYMTEKGVSHEYPVLIDLREALAD